MIYAKKIAWVFALLICLTSINTKNLFPDTNKTRTLFQAVYAGDSEEAKALLANGADVNAKNKDGGTVLITAAACGETEITKILLANGADVNAKNKDGDTALMKAAWADETEIVKILLANGADVNAKDKSGYTALMRAPWRGQTEIAKILVASGADVNAKNKHGDTALITAVAEGETEIAKILVASGADVNAKNKHGDTALMKAAWADATESIKILLANGADVNAKDKSGDTALMEAARYDHTESIKILLANGADVNAKDEFGGTALMRAAKMGHTESIKILLANGADVNAKHKDGGTALMKAAYWGHTKTMMAIGNMGHTESIKILLANGADVNAKNRDGETALAIGESPEIGRILLEAGAVGPGDSRVHYRDISGAQLYIRYDLTAIQEEPEAAGMEADALEALAFCLEGRSTKAERCEMIFRRKIRAIPGSKFWIGQGVRNSMGDLKIPDKYELRSGEEIGNWTLGSKRNVFHLEPNEWVELPYLIIKDIGEIGLTVVIPTRPTKKSRGGAILARYPAEFDQTSQDLWVRIARMLQKDGALFCVRIVRITDPDWSNFFWVHKTRCE